VCVCGVYVCLCACLFVVCDNVWCVRVRVRVVRERRAARIWGEK